MGIELSSNFDVKTALPLDSRLVVADQTARDAIDALVRYEGMIVYVAVDETNYQLVGGITNSDWVEVGSGSGSGSGSGNSTVKNYFDNPTFSTELEGSELFYERSHTATGCFDGGGSGIAEFTAHGANDNDRAIIFGDINYPSGLTPGVVYYLRVIDVNNLGFSLTSGGSIIAFTNTSLLGYFFLRIYKTPTHLSTSIETSTPEYRDWETDRKSTRLNSSHSGESRMPSSA